MMSRGSVIPLFIKQALAGDKLTITNPEMTRFLMSLDESVELVEHAFLNATNGDLFVRKANACTIKTLASAVWRIINPTRDPEFNMIGTEDQGGYFRVGMDTRSLDYSMYFENGSNATIQEPYSSHSTTQLQEKEVMDLLKGLPKFKNLLNNSIENR
jgi:UDP-glucose 4-epimerase